MQYGFVSRGNRNRYTALTSEDRIKVIYPLAKNLLFLLAAETSHDVALKTLKLMPGKLLELACDNSLTDQPKEVMGITFPNAVGLAAGLDKNADYIDALGKFGFGFIEVGSITPKPQAGNKKPRMFRLTGQQAIINRLGFNNKGIDYLISRVRQRHFGGILGINIGKNLSTPLKNAHEDYLICLKQAYPHADYITVNISSPNTPGLRDLQLGESLQSLLAVLKQAQESLTQEHGKYIPMVVKIAPDMADADIALFCDSARRHRIDGIIAGNTTASRAGTEASPHTHESGGLSGQPLTTRARHNIVQLTTALAGEIPVIACGGIGSAEDAIGHLDAGAELVQLYTGFIYNGPPLINDIRRAIAAR